MICDLYGTLLKVLTPETGDEWQSGWETLMLGLPFVTLTEFNEHCRCAVESENARRRQQGEAFPEVNWLEILAAMPWSPESQPFFAEKAKGLSRLHAACSRKCIAMPGALEALSQLRAGGMLTGIASNAQDYTREEFSGAGFHIGDFSQDITFLSGERGFAKPSPRVFAHLSAALAARGLSPQQTLMTGDRPDNDIAPASAAGWQTWLLTESPGDGRTGGTWEQLRAFLLPPRHQ